MFRWLADHPQVCGSSVKEPFFLMDRGHNLLRPDANFHDHGLEGYAKFFAACDANQPVVFEATTHYLYQQTAIEVLADLPTQPKLLFILRRPSARLYSSYRYAKNNIALLDQRVSFAEYVRRIRDPESDSLDEVLTRPSAVLKTEVEQGEYATHFERWLERFDRGRLRVELLEEIQHDARTFMKSLADWLHIDPGFYATYDFTPLNESMAIRNQPLHRLARRLAAAIPASGPRNWLRSGYLRLQDRGGESLSPEDQSTLDDLDLHYEPHNQRLATLFNLDLSCWQTSSETG